MRADLYENRDRVEDLRVKYKQRKSQFVIELDHVHREG